MLSWIMWLMTVDGADGVENLRYRERVGMRSMGLEGMQGNGREMIAMFGMRQVKGGEEDLVGEGEVGRREPVLRDLENRGGSSRGSRCNAGWKVLWLVMLRGLGGSDDWSSGHIPSRGIF